VMYYDEVPIQSSGLQLAVEAYGDEWLVEA
jgi:hypothetical protein